MRVSYFFSILLFTFLSITASAQTLAEAISNKDTAAAAKLILAGADVNKPDENGSTFLISACRWGTDTLMEKFLLQHGAHPDSPRSPKGRTSLIVACAYYGDIPMCSLLLQFGADVNAAANDGTTALMLAAKNEKSNLVAYLIKMGANAAAKDVNGNTALVYAQNGTVDEWMLKSVPDGKIDKDATIKILTSALATKP